MTKPSMYQRVLFQEQLAATERKRLCGSFKVGDRVRTLVAKDERMIGINIPAGVTGTIARIEPYNGMCILAIKLDRYFDDLDEWSNVVEFYLEGDSEALDDYVIAL